MQRLIDAARLLCFRVGRHCNERKECMEAAAKLDDAIMEADRQLSEDELPVDETFLREMFPISESRYDDTILVGRDMVLVESAAGTWSLWHEGEEIVESMTRKKVCNLVELLKDEA